MKFLPFQKQTHLEPLFEIFKNKDKIQYGVN